MDAEGSGESRSAEGRHAEIIALVRQRGFVTNEDLAQRFQVTVQTIRRDLAQLSDAGHVSRFHGGAGLPSSVENIDYSARKVLNLNEKRRILLRTFKLGRWLKWNEGLRIRTPPGSVESLPLTRAVAPTTC